MGNKIKIGNVEIELNGKPFVLGVDTFDGTDWLYDEMFETDEEAITFAKSKGGTMLKVHAYNKDGQHIGSGGTF